MKAFMKILFIFMCLYTLASAVPQQNGRKPRPNRRGGYGRNDDPWYEVNLLDAEHCLPGFTGFTPEVQGVINECMQEVNAEKNHRSDSCFNLCMWWKLGYLLFDYRTAGVTYSVQSIDKVSRQLYNNPSSIQMRTQTFIHCFDSANPKPNLVRHGYCQSLTGFEKCYKQRMMTNCPKQPSAASPAAQNAVVPQSAQQAVPPGVLAQQRPSAGQGLQGPVAPGAIGQPGSSAVQLANAAQRALGQQRPAIPSLPRSPINPMMPQG